MDHLVLGFHLQRRIACLFAVTAVFLSSYDEVVSEKTEFQSEDHARDKFVLSDPPIGLFEPIEISPSVVPNNSYPVEPLSPMYSSFPRTYEPVLTGRCPINFSFIQDIVKKTAFDCSAPLATLVGNVICCPQVNSLMHIFQGTYSSESSTLVLQHAAAADCFSDIISILASRGATSSIPTLCSVKASNLTGGSCPVKDITSFEKTVNTSKLLEACSTIDPLKECCRPLCQPAIVEAALQISLRGASLLENSNIPGSASGINVVSDCKGVVYAWLSRKLSSDAANTAFRILSGCKVNKVCPLTFEEPTPVIKACRDRSSPKASCCSSLKIYIASIQKQMLITNRQAINCATMFGSMLQKGGVVTNIYDLCDVDLKDFSLQGHFTSHGLFYLSSVIVSVINLANMFYVLSHLLQMIEAAYGQQGCLLRSLPADIVLDNVTGFSFTCDLSDNIAAPWPSSSSLSSLSLCAPEMSLPALPVPQTSGGQGTYNRTMRTIITFLYILFNFLV